MFSLTRFLSILSYAFLFQAYFGLIGAFMGALALIGTAVNAQSISSLSREQDSICTEVSKLDSNSRVSYLFDLL